MNLDAAIKAAQERIHRSTGQRCRWALVAIRERCEKERNAMFPPERTQAEYFDPRQNSQKWMALWPWNPYAQQALPLSAATNPWHWLMGNTLPTIQASSVRHTTSVREGA